MKSIQAFFFRSINGDTLAVAFHKFAGGFRRSAAKARTDAQPILNGRSIEVLMDFFGHGVSRFFHSSDLYSAASAPCAATCSGAGVSAGLG
jgi:hypothetical protein